MLLSHNVKKFLRKAAEFAVREKFMLGTLAIAIAALSFMYNFSYPISRFIEIKKFEANATRLRSGIAEDMKYVSRKTGEMASSSALAAAIEGKNADAISSVIQSNLKASGLNSAVATDEMGLALSRAEVPSAKGDYLFQTTSYGRAVADGRSVVSIEKGSDLPMLVIAGYPVKDGDRMVGAIFAGYSVNDNYANSLKNKYLSDDENLIFYSRSEGAIGTTFNSANTKNFIAAYFNPESDWVKDGKTDGEIVIEGKSYFANNIVFNGLDGSSGGVVALYPDNHLLHSAIFAAVVMAIFALIVLYFHIRHEKRKYRSGDYVTLIICLFIVGLFALTMQFWEIYKSVMTVGPPPYTIYNSIMKLEPGYGMWDRSFEHKVSVEITTGGEAVNAAKAELSFDPKQVEVKEILVGDSFCGRGMLLEKNVDNQKGKISVACAIPSPGFSGQNGKIADLILQPLDGGNVILNFTSGTEVLANDGLGTDVLRNTEGGVYRVVSRSQSSTGMIPFVDAFSPTHPNSSRWYDGRDVSFYWQALKGYDYVYSLDKAPVSAADVLSNLTSSHSASFEGLADGIYYFHIAAAKNGKVGPVSDYKIMIETAPPSVPVIKASQANVAEGQVIRLQFDSSDSESGIEDYFYIKFDDGVFLPTKSPLFISMPAGSHVITVRAFDNAGNYADGSMTVDVAKNPMPR